MNAASSPNSAPADPAIGGLVPFSTVDWPGRLAAVVFVAGCPWRCGYCHNPHLQRRQPGIAWRDVHDLLAARRGLLDGVVFSGGEPTSEPLLRPLIAQTRALGLSIGLHTAGIYPVRLADVLPLLDWVGFDVKTDAAGHDALTRRRGSARGPAKSLDLLLASDVPFECRTTWHPSWLPPARLFDLAQALAGRGVEHYVVQRFRAPPGGIAGPALPSQDLDPDLLARLTALFPRFDYRAG